MDAKTRLVLVVSAVVAGACGRASGGPLDGPSADGGGVAVDAACVACADGSPSDATAPPSDGGAPDAGSDATCGGDGGAACATCPTTDPVAAADLPWKPPSALQAGQCTTADLTAIQGFLTSTPGATNAQLEAFVLGRSQACHDCVFTDASAPTWGPIPMSGGKLVTVNIGGCFALVSGVVPCGKAIQNEFDCEFVACADCASSPAFQVCQKVAQQGACKPFVTAIQSACVGVPTTVDDACGTYLDSIRVQCVQ
jgi:hypothetical protein